MKHYHLNFIIPAVFLLSQSVPAQEVAFETTPIDTNIYNTSPYAVCQNVNQLLLVNDRFFEPLNQSCAYLNKTTSQYDVFINNVKTVSFSVPQLPENMVVKHLQLVSQTMFNNDNNWEAFWLYSKPDGSNPGSMLTNSNGAVIWSTSADEYGGWLCFDGTYTYIKVVAIEGSKNYSRYYRFHPALTTSSQSLAKSKGMSALPVPIVSFNAMGDFRIKLSRSAAGATTVSAYNLLGQQFFSQTVADLKQDVTFTIPASSVPGSPIITRVRNDLGISATKSVPVK